VDRRKTDAPESEIIRASIASVGVNGRRLAQEILSLTGDIGFSICCSREKTSAGDEGPVEIYCCWGRRVADIRQKSFNICRQNTPLKAMVNIKNLYKKYSEYA
jgi:hypothetical protein